MRLFLVILITTILPFLSCTQKKQQEPESNVVNARLLKKFMQLYRYKIIDEGNFERFAKLNNGTQIDSFLNLHIKRKMFVDSISNIIDDTIFASVGITELEKIVKAQKNPNYTMVRLITRSVVGISIIDAYKNEDSAKISWYELKFDAINCHFPSFYESGEGKNFTTKCFSLQESGEKNITLEQWQELRKVISETDFLQTSYFVRFRGFCCFGKHYALSFAEGLSLGDEIYTLEDSCPSEKTALFLVSEKLIALKNKMQ